MRTVIDSSALVKRYIREAGTAAVLDTLAAATELGVCVLVVPEVCSALARRRREGELDVANVNNVKERLLLHLADATTLNLTPGVVARSLTLLDEHVLRTMDALHVAAALEWRAELFVTADRRQATAATATGLHTRWVG